MRNYDVDICNVTFPVELQTEPKSQRKTDIHRKKKRGEVNPAD